MADIQLEFVTTATCRPAIIRRTYQSFVDKLSGIDYKNSTLYLNVDPLPSGQDPAETVAMAKEFFGNVVVRMPETANFCVALKWGFSQVTGSHFFYLQDDWIMIRKCTIQELFKRLSKPIIRGTKKKNIGVTLRAYRFIKDNRICLSPSLYLTKWAKETSAKLADTQNPERGMRDNTPKEYIDIHYPVNTKLIMVKDIGRKWLKQNKIKRNTNNPRQFITWK